MTDHDDKARTAGRDSYARPGLDAAPGRGTGGTAGHYEDIDAGQTTSARKLSAPSRGEQCNQAKPDRAPGETELAEGATMKASCCRVEPVFAPVYRRLPLPIRRMVRACRHCGEPFLPRAAWMTLCTGCARWRWIAGRRAA